MATVTAVGTQWHRSLFYPSRDRVMVLVWLAAAVLAWLEWGLVSEGQFPIDSPTYWAIWHQPHLYGLAPGAYGAYLYTPVFAQLIWPLTLLPWPLFEAVWFGLAVAAYLWMVRPVGWVWGVPLLTLGLEDIRAGQITWLIALSMAVGFTRSPGWLGALYTKVSPAVGVLWLVPQRRWADLRTFALVGLGVFAVSFALAPHLWVEWFDFLTAHRTPGTTARLVASALIVLVASWRRWPLLLPVALFVSAPIAALYSIGLFVAIPRLLDPARMERARRPFGGPVATARRILDLP